MSAVAIIILVTVSVCAYCGSFLGSCRDQPILSVERAVLLPALFGTVGFLAHLCLLFHHSFSLGESAILFSFTPVAVSVGGLFCGRCYRRLFHPEDFRY